MVNTFSHLISVLFQVDVDFLWVKRKENNTLTSSQVHGTNMARRHMTADRLNLGHAAQRPENITRNVPSHSETATSINDSIPEVPPQIHTHTHALQHTLRAGNNLCDSPSPRHAALQYEGPLKWQQRLFPAPCKSGDMLNIPVCVAGRCVYAGYSVCLHLGLLMPVTWRSLLHPHIPADINSH